MKKKFSFDRDLKNETFEAEIIVTIKLKLEGKQSKALRMLS